LHVRSGLQLPRLTTETARLGLAIAAARLNPLEVAPTRQSPSIASVRGSGSLRGRQLQLGTRLSLVDLARFGIPNLAVANLAAADLPIASAIVPLPLHLSAQLGEIADLAAVAAHLVVAIA
jgi:hypothetical protein